MLMLQRIFSAADGYGNLADILGEALTLPEGDADEDHDRRVPDEVILQIYE